MSKFLVVHDEDYSDFCASYEEAEVLAKNWAEQHPRKEAEIFQLAATVKVEINVTVRNES
jgi:FMN-dependent NADH-azoreductase